MKIFQAKDDNSLLKEQQKPAFQENSDNTDPSQMRIAAQRVAEPMVYKPGVEMIEKIRDIRSYDMCPSPDEKMPLKEIENAGLKDSFDTRSVHVSGREGVKTCAYKVLDEGDMIPVELDKEMLAAASKKFRTVKEKAISKAACITLQNKWMRIAIRKY